MGFCSELHWATYCEPHPDSEYMKKREQEYLETEKRLEAYFWEVQCQAWPIDMKEKELLVKAICERRPEDMGNSRSQNHSCTERQFLAITERS